MPSPDSQALKVKRRNKQSQRQSCSKEPLLTDVTEQGVSISRWVSLLLGLLFLMMPAMGSPTQALLQDTLKSAIVAFMTLAALWVFFWRQTKHQNHLVRWHQVMWIPLILLACALLSMVWSHTYLAGVESVRWFLFSLILWLGANCKTEDLQNRVIWSIHWGSTIASVWAALQFWFEFDFFPQGPIPGSTFVNRNFFAEYAICVLPYSLFLLLRSKPGVRAFILVFSIGLNIVALLMTGTRSALVALTFLFFLLPFVYIRCRRSLESSSWTTWHGIAIAGVLAGTIVSLGSIPTGNAKLITEFGALNPVQRASVRAASIAVSEEYSSGSFSLRAAMWKTTIHMIADKPLFGVGAGAWEVHSPVYQQPSAPLDTDYYAHNEYLQLLAEYGLAGGLVLICLVTYFLRSAWKAWDDTSPTGFEERPFRAAALGSLLMLFVVSSLGFPWRMAATGALFSVSLSFLAASDIRTGAWTHALQASGERIRLLSKWGLAMCAICITMSIYITQRAVRSEWAIVQSIKLALTITKSGKPHHAYWVDAKIQMLQLIKNGIALNPHYRKLTPMVADELASWEDWSNAMWIWQSVLDSRPNVVAIIVNMAKGQLALGSVQQALNCLEKAKRLQPGATVVRALEALIQLRTGHFELANQGIKKLLSEDAKDYELLFTAYVIGEQTRDAKLMIRALELRILHWPKDAPDAWVGLGKIYAFEAAMHDEAKAVFAFQRAIDSSSLDFRDKTLGKIPTAYHPRLTINRP
jgi:O-antigen ligase